VSCQVPTVEIVTTVKGKEHNPLREKNTEKMVKSKVQNVAETRT